MRGVNQVDPEIEASIEAVVVDDFAVRLRKRGVIYESDNLQNFP